MAGAGCEDRLPYVLVGWLMVTYSDNMAALQDLDGWRRDLFATGCVQRIQPLVEACASPESAALYARGLRSAWDGTTGAERSEVNAGLGQVPELSAESSDEREYYAMIPIRVLSAVLSGPEDGKDLAGLACSQALNMLADVDYTLLPPEERPRIITPGSEPPPGRWESAEVEAQSRSITLLRAASSREQAAAELRSQAEREAAELTVAMPAFLERGQY